MFDIYYHELWSKASLNSNEHIGLPSSLNTGE